MMRKQIVSLGIKFHWIIFFIYQGCGENTAKNMDLIPNSVLNSIWDGLSQKSGFEDYQSTDFVGTCVFYENIDAFPLFEGEKNSILLKIKDKIRQGFYVVRYDEKSASVGGTFYVFIDPEKFRILGYYFLI